ncbi:MAG: hypothetical protein HON90_11040 [Halobacteriovoraceae bacterium]|jgi:predicted esterase|nr:hypothetical protein [Halobacteriovoraceae bacterium]
MKKHFTSIPLKITHTVEAHFPVNPKRVYLLLHGYMQTGEFLYNQFRAALPDDAIIIAPNAPFLLPYAKKEHFEMRYAWYFFDPKVRVYYIDYDAAAEYIKSLLIEMDIIRKPITVIGYSQGGYLAPKIAEIIPAVDTVIGLACSFRNEKFEYRQSVIMHQINSKQDLIIDHSSAKEEFLKLRERGNVGRFVSLEESTHRIDVEYLSELKSFI